MLPVMPWILRLILLLALGAASGCYSVPETGRRAVILPLIDDAAKGAASFAEMKTKGKISDDPVFNAQVQRVGRRIAEAVGNDLPGANWEFVVFEAPLTANAFALPGGKVGVYSGLLYLVDSDDELAVVMGHEIAHVTARHGAQRMTESVLAVAGGVLLEVVTRNKGNRDALLIGYGLTAGGTVLAFTREHESEADYIGIRYAAKAGYDPRAAVTFWKKMLKGNQPEGQPGSLPGYFLTLLSSHPANARRIADLEKAVPEALPIYEGAKIRY
jgi:predicted Zn-dependent protease